MTNNGTVVFRYALLGRDESDEMAIDRRHLFLAPLMPPEIRRRDEYFPEAAPHRMVRVRIDIEPHIDDLYMRLAEWDQQMWDADGRSLDTSNPGDRRVWAEKLVRLMDEADRIGLIRRMV